MRTNQYMADAESIGNWGGNEEQAIAIWNKYIAPVLIDAHEKVEAVNDYNQRDLDAIGYLSQWAWDEFCGRPVEDDQDAARLGNELRQKLA